MGHLGGIGVGINQADAGDAGALGLGDRDFLVIAINHEHHRGVLGHLEDAGEVFGHADHLALDRGFFLGGELGEFAILLLLLVFLKLRDGFLDGGEIGQGAAEPAIDTEGHASSGRGFAHDLAGLFLGADKEHVAAGSDLVFDKGVSFLEELVGLAQVNDGDALTMVEDVGLGARVPALGLVAEVDACIEQVLRCDVHGMDGSIYLGERQVGQWAALRSF